MVSKCKVVTSQTAEVPPGHSLKAKINTHSHPLITRSHFRKLTFSHITWVQWVVEFNQCTKHLTQLTTKWQVIRIHTKI